MTEKKFEFEWKAEGFICPHCGTPNPDQGPKCGNCDMTLSVVPKGLLTETELLTFKAATRRTRRQKIIYF